MNKTMLIGNLTKDPELRSTSSGKQVASCSIATNKRYKDQQGQTQTVSQFHNLVIWGNAATAFAQYTKKGSKLYIEGELTHRSYESKDGIKRNVSEIVVEKFEFLDSKPQAPAGSKPAQSSEEMAPESQSVETIEEFAKNGHNGGEDEEIKIENIPF